MKTEAETLATVIRYYTQGRLHPSMAFDDAHYTDANGGTMQCGFWLNIPRLGMLLKANRDALTEKLRNAFMEAFADNEFAREKMGALLEESKKLAILVQELTNKVAELQKFKDHYDLNYRMAHGEK